jgi:hypothetical protein
MEGSKEMKINKTITIDIELWNRVKQTYSEPFSRVIEFALESLLEPEQNQPLQEQEQEQKQETENENDLYLEWLLARKKAGKPIASIEEWKKSHKKA